MSLISFYKDHKFSTFFIGFVVTVSFIVSIVFCFIGKIDRRHTFIFPSVEENQYAIESRILPKSYKSSMEYYVDELLLGPQTERCNLIFAKGTHLLSFMNRDGVVYINLSDDVLLPSAKQISIKKACGLLEKNIRNNFPSTKEVKIFVNGNAVFTY